MTSLPLDETIKEEPSYYPFDIRGMEVKSQKAMKILGRDPSNEKVIDTLGIKQEELQQVQMKQFEKEEEVIKRQRMNSASKNKKESQKALGVLGIDPSTEKVVQKLGVSQVEIELARLEEQERLEDLIKKQRDLECTKDKKHSKKALEVLGYDVSAHKVMNTLGLTDKDLEQIKQDNYILLEEQY